MAEASRRDDRADKVDLAWNYASLAVLGGAGLVLNLLVADRFGPEALGAFNQVFAVYIVLSQFAALGVHHSVLQSVAGGNEEADHPAVLTAGLAVSGVLGALAGSFSVLAASLPVTATFFNDDVRTGLVLIGPALFFFGLNKVHLGAINGLGRMRTFAVAQASRYFLILLALLVMIAVGRTSRELPVIFLISEAILFAALCYTNRRFFGFAGGRFVAIMKHHARFGARAFGSGVFLELNSRLDILLLGIWLPIRDVGIYSFASTFADGYLQLITVMRNKANPMFARDWRSQNLPAVEANFRRLRRMSVIVMAAGYVALLVGVAVVIELFLDRETYFQSLPVLAVLGLGPLIGSVALPFDGLLLAAGKPALYTTNILLLVGTNALLNVWAIPRYGILGSAFATASALILAIFYLRVFVRRTTGLDLLSLRTAS